MNKEQKSNDYGRCPRIVKILRNISQHQNITPQDKNMKRRRRPKEEDKLRAGSI
jgi:hypothetical protein